MAREKRLEKRLGRGIVAMINQASQAIKDADQQVDGQDAFTVAKNAYRKHVTQQRFAFAVERNDGRYPFNRFGMAAMDRVYFVNLIATAVSIAVAIIVYFFVLIKIGGLTREDILQAPKGTAILRVLQKIRWI